MESDYRSYVGIREKYDIIGAQQFSILVEHGLRDFHKLLDVGCGSLRSGRLFIPYLLKGGYFGIEPESWLLNEGINNETGKDLIEIKSPAFNHNRNFDLSVFDTKFDFILFHSIFTHSSQEQIHKCIDECLKIMNPSALIIGTFIEGIENYSGSEWIYPDCTTYAEAFLANMVESHGLIYERLPNKHPNYHTWFKLHKKCTS